MPIKALFKAIQNVHLFHMASLIFLTLKVKTRLENPKYKQIAFCNNNLQYRGRVKGRGLTGC